MHYASLVACRAYGGTSADGTVKWLGQKRKMAPAKGRTYYYASPSTAYERASARTMFVSPSVSLDRSVTNPTDFTVSRITFLPTATTVRPHANKRRRYRCLLRGRFCFFSHDRASRLVWYSAVHNTRLTAFSFCIVADGHTKVCVVNVLS